MRLGAAHLGYCTNVHAGESWPDVRAQLASNLPAVKALASPDAPLGIGLRLSARAAHELSDRRAREELSDLLARYDLYVFTINGFAYGTFHGRRVKEHVFRPDWRSEARLRYTNALAELLAGVLPEGVDGSISTLPFAARAARFDTRAAEAIARRLLQHVSVLHGIRERTGKTVCLAVEPEPFGYAETVGEAVGFLERHLLGRSAVRRFARESGLDTWRAEAAIRRHLGLCLDACHMAVGFEDPEETVRWLVRAGIRIGKVQVSAALELSAPAPAHALERFAEGVYLHQVVEHRGDRMARFRDLPEALAEAGGPPPGATWRVHFHVPVFRAELGPFRSTQAYLVDLLATCRRHAARACYEVETYTWGVLPDEHRDEPLVRGLARELEWTARCLSE